MLPGGHHHLVQILKDPKNLAFCCTAADFHDELQ